MKRSSSRLLCALLLCAMLPIGTLACSNQNNDNQADPKTPTTTVGNEAVTTPGETVDDTVDSNGFLKDTLPADLNYNQDTVSFLTWSDVEHEEFTVENLTGETVNDALYRRNQTVEERLGVKLNFNGKPGNSDNVSAFTQVVGNAIQSGSRDFDIVAAYSLTTAACANQNYLMDLLSLPHLNFEMPWWPERLITEATINNKLYFCSGDISANMLYMMYVCYFNKDIMQDYKLENPQDLVLDGKWTYDKFFSMCEGIYSDLNGNGEKDQDDQFGYMSSGIHNDPWLYGAGCLLVDKNADGVPIVSPTWSSEKLIGIIEMVNHNLWDTQDCIYTTSVKHQGAFAEGRLLFATDRARIAITKLSVDGLSFGIVPCPKYDEAQESYVTVVGNPFTLYALPSDCRAPEEMAAVLECFASEGYRQVTPALFEITLKVKYVEDEVSSEMYDLIRENVTFDLGRIFSNVLIGQGHFRDAIKYNQNAWASIAKTTGKLMTNKLNKMVTKAFE